MNTFSFLLLIISSVSVAGMDKEKNGIINARTPENSPGSSSTAARTSQTGMPDAIFEPKLDGMNCINNCTCIKCLEKSCCELDKIQSKFMFIESLLKTNKNTGQSSQEAMAIARMMAKVVALHKESKKLKLITKQVKNSYKAQKEAAPEPRAQSSGSVGPRSSSDGYRLTTPRDDSDDEAYKQLTNSSRDNMRWRLAQLNADIL